jgi:hypothetical protein
MPNNASGATAPVIIPDVVTWKPTFIVTDGPPFISNPNPGPNGNIAGPRPFFQPQGPNSRSIVPVPGTVYGDVAEATMVQGTLGVMLPCYPPPQFVGEFPVFYPGVGWVSSDNAPNQQAS